jgi:hypothetical protein
MSSAHRNYGLPRRVERRDPLLSQLARLDPMTKLALFLAAASSIFCVWGVVMLSIIRATI